jgi:DNA invertase Pin-like site-specific DNA recombinase
LSVTNFAFYGRVSTEDQQDPESSRQWQLDRSRQLVDPAGGVIAAEYFDVGQSRSLPWKRRPEAARLLEAIADPKRAFDAVVIGEPQRAFYGNQFSLTFPLFEHYGVSLWVPEVGGPIDPGSEAHDMMMMLYGGMSKGERSRIKTRVRAAMEAQVRHEGRFQGGRPPYGYTLVDAGAHPNPSKAGDGKRLHRLEVDHTTAAVVRRIFGEYLQGRGIYAIAEGLTRDGISSPSANDPVRNPHRQGSHGAWGKSAVRTILQNRRYTGYEVWNKQRRDEVLIDVDDVALGHETRMRWNGKDAWIISSAPTHEAIVDVDTFETVQMHIAQRANGRGSRERSSRHSYLLRGLLICGLCGRRMQSHWKKEQGKAWYRCRFAAEYALAEYIEHPKTVNVQEGPIEEALDAWLSSVFDPDNVEATCASLSQADNELREANSAARDTARRRASDCDRRLRNYRKALDEGADPAIVTSWIAEVQSERAILERAATEVAPDQMMTPDEVRLLVEQVADKATMLVSADRTTKANLYAALGLTLTYEPVQRTVRVEARPSDWCANGRVGGGT